MLDIRVTDIVETHLRQSVLCENLLERAGDVIQAVGLAVTPDKDIIRFRVDRTEIDSVLFLFFPEFQQEFFDFLQKRIHPAAGHALRTVLGDNRFLLHNRMLDFQRVRFKIHRIPFQPQYLRTPQTVVQRNINQRLQFVSFKGFQHLSGFFGSHEFTNRFPFLLLWKRYDGHGIPQDKLFDQCSLKDLIQHRCVFLDGHRLQTACLVVGSLTVQTAFIVILNVFRGDLIDVQPQRFEIRDDVPCDIDLVPFPCGKLDIRLFADQPFFDVIHEQHRFTLLRFQIQIFLYDPRQHGFRTFLVAAYFKVRWNPLALRFSTYIFVTEHSI